MSNSPSQQSQSAKKLVAARFVPEMAWAPIDEAFAVVTGTTGPDTLFDTASSDQIDALDGDDTITVTNGQDSVAGGTGSDRLIVDYAAGTAGLQVQSAPSANVALGGFDGGWNDFAGRGVTYTSIEHFTISTGSGNDNFATASGDDVVSLGLGNDIVNVGTGTDQGDGGGGEDGISADMSAASGAIAWSLLANTYSGPVGTSFTNFEYFGTISTGGGNDVVTTSAVARNEIINLGGGDDSATVFNGQDTVNGGLGSDRLIIDYSAAANNLTTANGPTANGALGGFDGQYSNFAGRSVSYTSIEHVTITTGSGADSITTATGNDIISTGAGNDTINSGNGDDSLNAGLGVNIANGGLGRDRLVVDYSAATTRVVTPGFPSANANGGFDGQFADFAGNQVTYTSIEDITLTSGSANDSIFTASGADVISTGLGDDTIGAGAGDDFIDGGLGDDQMNGESGNDIYVVSSTGDLVSENPGQGTDEIRTALGVYTMVSANVENLTGTNAAGQALTGSGFANRITGNSGADTIDGGAGIDTLIGGLGDDTYVVDNAGEVVTELAGEGTDTIRTALASYTLASANVENLTGTLASGQTLTGDGGANRITGLGGNDTLDGAGGDDTLVGGAGGDRYIVDSAGDIVIENAGEGIDSINTALASYSIAALGNVENLIGTVTTGQSLTGNNAANTIAGGSGNDMLDGGFGFDVMAGGAGDDIYFVDNVFDRVDENAGAGTDEIRTNLASYTLAANVERLTGTATNGAQALRGNALDNVIAAGAGDDQIDLRDGGDDSVSGGLGNDGFFFGAAFTAADSVDGGAGANDQIGLQGDYTGANALTLGAGGVSNITGVEVIALLGGFSYSITAIQANLAAGQLLTVHATALGAADNFTFDGSAETDGGRFIVYGGLGIDTLTGGSGDDGFYFGEARFSANDTVNGGAGANDQLGLDGNYGSAGASFVLSGANVSGIELVALLQFTGAPPKSFFIATDQSFVAAGQTMTIWGVPVQTGITFNGSAETDGGRFMIYGGLGADTLTGGGGDDWFQGGAGGDSMTGGAGADTFAYTAASQSTGVNFDTLVGFDDAADKIDLPGAVAGFAAPAAGTLTLASFDADLAAGVDALLGPNQAIVFTASAGDMAGRIFGVVDANGDGNYQAGSDFVFEFVSPVTPIDQVGLFI